MVVGDTHGQLHDVIGPMCACCHVAGREWCQQPEIVYADKPQKQVALEALSACRMNAAGPPSPTQLYVWNGDFVDRGAWGVELLAVLAAWKVPLLTAALSWMHAVRRSMQVYARNPVRLQKAAQPEALLISACHEAGAAGSGVFAAWQSRVHHLHQDVRFLPGAVQQVRRGRQQGAKTLFVLSMRTFPVLLEVLDLSKLLLQRRHAICLWLQVVFKQCKRLFAALPLAACVAGSTLILHGGEPCQFPLDGPFV